MSHGLQEYNHLGLPLVGSPLAAAQGAHRVGKVVRAEFPTATDDECQMIAGACLDLASQTGNVESAAAILRFAIVDNPFDDQ